MMTYGDGLSNVNLRNLLKFHKRHKKLITLTAETLKTDLEQYIRETVPSI